MHSAGLRCAGHQKQLQRGQPVRPLREAMTPWQRLVGAALSVGDGIASGELDRDESDRRRDRLRKAAQEWALRTCAPAARPVTLAELVAAAIRVAECDSEDDAAWERVCKALRRAAAGYAAWHVRVAPAQAAAAA